MSHKILDNNLVAIQKITVSLKLRNFHKFEFIFWN